MKLKQQLWNTYWHFCVAFEREDNDIEAITQLEQTLSMVCTTFETVTLNYDSIGTYTNSDTEATTKQKRWFVRTRRQWHLSKNSNATNVNTFKWHSSENTATLENIVTLSKYVGARRQWHFSNHSTQLQCIMTLQRVRSSEMTVTLKQRLNWSI